MATSPLSGDFARSVKGAVSSTQTSFIHGNKVSQSVLKVFFDTPSIPNFKTCRPE
jgi:hypothetical protein